MNFIVYSHSSYLDILEIQTEYIHRHTNKTTLLINRGSHLPSRLLDPYSSVIYYNDENPYAQRIIECMGQIDHTTFLLTHDIDILLNCDSKTIRGIFDFVESGRADRVDLKQTTNLNSFKFLDINKLEKENLSPSSAIDLQIGQFLVKEEDPSNYIYNVNPSIWSKRSLTEIMLRFPNKDYRNIEGADVQSFCQKYKVYKMYSGNHLKCGYFDCLDFFVFLHITHGGRLLPINESLTSLHGQPYTDISHEYGKIISKFDLLNSPRL